VGYGVASRPTPRLLEAVVALRGTPEEVLLPAPAPFEILYGLDRVRDPRADRTAAWWREAVLGSAGVRVAPLDGDAAIVSARLRAALPLPPSARRAGRSKPEHRVAWINDIQIAGIASVIGRPLVTANDADFKVLGALLRRLFARLPALVLREP